MDRKPPPPPASARSIPRMPPPPPPKRPAAPTAPAPAVAPAAPPPPAVAKPAPAAPARPSDPGRITSTQQLIDAASSAARLRDEQLQARVRYYQQDMKTNAELDAITAQVVEELRSLGRIAAEQKPVVRPVAEVEIELIHELRTCLEKLFAGARNKLLTRKIEEVQRRITQLFFNSELYARLAEGSRDVPAATWPEQVLYFAIKRQEAAITAELDALPVTDPSVRERAHEELERYLKSLTTDFLSKTTPELERLLAIYKEHLTRFFATTFPEELGDFAWEVIKQSRVAHGTDLGYKITADRFHAFREAFDRKFLEHLVLNVQTPIAKQAAAEAGSFREATRDFVADPHIHAEICAVINDALYDYMHGEGFLDLPTDWKRLLKDQ
ncbi:MAG: hypothetical protein U0234_12060 [Sandaracinus sp.]